MTAKKIRDIEDFVTGRTERFHEIYSGAFSDAEAERMAAAAKKQNRTAALLVAAVIVLTIIFLLPNAGGDEEPALDLSRPGAAEAVKTVDAEVRAEYGGYAAEERTVVRVLPKEPSEAEAAEMIQGLMLRLPGMISGENASLDAVTVDLSLPSTDEETGASIFWTSGNARIVSNDGAVNILGADEGTAVTLTAYISLASVSESLHISLRTGAGIPEDRIDKALTQRLSEAVKEVSAARDGDAATLPSQTPDGVRLTWDVPEDEAGLPVLFGILILAGLCISGRYRIAAKHIEKARAEIERDFPDFIQKLVLLLGAGLVITSAIGRIADDYLETRDVYGKRRMFEELVAARDRMRAAGTSLVYEFSELARRSGLRELMRFSSTLADNIDKGSALTDKLRAESGLLWDSRKKRAEKESRIAETKLIFPMALQILVVIVITVVPAAFEMG